MDALGQAIAKQHGVVVSRGPLDDFADAVSRLSDSGVDLDETGNLLLALERAVLITTHDSVMLPAAHLRSNG